MSLKISYRLVGSGWSECVISCADTTCTITASYLSDALGNLVLSALGVLTGFVCQSFRFDEEPGEYRWVIELIAPNEIAIQILSFDELWGNKPNSEGKLLFRVNCMPIEFAKAVHVAATAVLEENGEEGYRGKWNEHAFPMRLLALLGEEIALLTVSGLLTAFFP